jgi:hypothetical protein
MSKLLRQDKKKNVLSFGLYVPNGPEDEKGVPWESKHGRITKLKSPINPRKSIITEFWSSDDRTLVACNVLLFSHCPEEIDI